MTNTTEQTQVHEEVPFWRRGDITQKDLMALRHRCRALRHRLKRQANLMGVCRRLVRRVRIQDAETQEKFADLLTEWDALAKGGTEDGT